MTAFPSPSVVRELAPGSRPRTVAWVSLRTLWHALYDPCPLVAERFGDPADDRFDRFVEALVTLGHPMDWTVHLELGTWWGVDDDAVWDELCAAAVRRWATVAPPGMAWIALRTAHLPGRVVAAERARSLREGPRLVRGRVSPGVDPGPFAHQSGSGAFVRPGPTWIPYRPVTSPEGQLPQ